MLPESSLHPSFKEQSWLSNKFDQLRLRRLQNSAARLADVHGVDSVSFERPGGFHVDFDRKSKQLALINPEGETKLIYALDGWQNYIKEIRAEIRRNSKSPIADMAETSLVDLAQNLRWYGHE
jgi:hypothetical protein